MFHLHNHNSMILQICLIECFLDRKIEVGRFSKLINIEKRSIGTQCKAMERHVVPGSEEGESGEHLDSQFTSCDREHLNYNSGSNYAHCSNNALSNNALESNMQPSYLYYLETTFSAK